MEYDINDLKLRYELELDKIKSKIKSSGAKSVLIQLPDGLKPWGPSLVDYLESETPVNISLWLGDCFGACDLPESKADLIIQFGHAPWE